MSNLRLEAVIGANYGDEGKGRTVDHLVARAQTPPLVVRHNSGGQAGHTVVRNGVRHVFSHLGSGTLAGASTYLGPKFVVHPQIFNTEWDELVTQGIMPQVTVDGSCMVTTPFDVLLNRSRERERGDARHGSCGAGFGETIARYERLGDRALDVFMESLLRDQEPERLVHLRAYARENGLDFDSFTFEEWLEGYFEQLRLMAERVSFGTLQTELRDHDHVIFEGAQGLELHQDHANFPHVTRCRTGIEDVVNLLGLNGIEGDLTAYYCTRTYLTRHGNGPLPNELTREQLEDRGYRIDDATNVENEHQGTLRFAELDETLLHVRVINDWLNGLNENESVFVDYRFSLTHADNAPADRVDELHDSLADRPTLIAYGAGGFTEDTAQRSTQVVG